MKVIFENPIWWNLMWIVAGVAILIAFAVSWKRRALIRFTGSRFASLLAPRVNIGMLRLKAVLFILAMAGLVFTIVDIRWGRHWVDVPQKGVDVMFLLDVSKSMLAPDVVPTRMERAEQYIKDMMDVMGGDRVGLVAFAGTAKVIVPMTSNYTEVSMALNEVGPASVSQGGTNIGDAIRVASRSFIDKTPDYKAIVIFTDGEDHESYPVEAAKVAFKEKGVKVFIVAMGDEKTGSRIPVSATREGNIYMSHEGKEVWSKMDKGILEEIALAGGGAMIPLGTKQADMAEIYSSFIDPMEDRQFEQARVSTYVPRFQWFLAPAVVLLLLESMITGKRRRKVVKNILPVLIFGVIFLAGSPDAMAETSQEAVIKANNDLKQGKVDQAMRIYENLQLENPADQNRLTYNKGVAQYRKGDMEKARDMLEKAGEQGSAQLEAKARYNIGNCYYIQAIKAAQAKKYDDAIKMLDDAVTQYRKSLELNTADTDARANVELATLLQDELMKKKEQQDQQKQNQKDQKDQKNQQNQQNKDQKKQDNKQDKQKKQDQQQKNDQQKNQDKNKQNKNKNDDQKKKQNRPDENKDKQDKKDQDKQKQDQNKNKDKQDKNKDQKDKKKDEQKNKDQKDKDKNKDKEKQKQDQPKDKKGDKNKDKQKSPSGGGQQKAPAKPQPKKMSKEEAARMLQGIRDRNFKRRKAKQVDAREFRPVVDKDW